MSPAPLKPGTRALGVAESYRGRDGEGTDSVLAGAVVRADRVVDGATFGRCRVGSLDSTAAIETLVTRLDREDVRFCFLAGIAPAWFNVVDLPALHEAVDRPVLSVSFEASPGLEAAIRREFEGAERERRLEVYRRAPPRRPVETETGTLYVRSVGVGDERAASLVRGYTADRRPEPLRVAGILAGAGRAFVAEGSDGRT